jgi:hypothetical protein
VGAGDGRPLMNPALENLICDVPDLADAFRVLDDEAISNRHARAVLRAFVWIEIVLLARFFLKGVTECL